MPIVLLSLLTYGIRICVELYLRISYKVDNSHAQELLAVSISVCWPVGLLR